MRAVCMLCKMPFQSRNGKWYCSKQCKWTAATVVRIKSQRRAGTRPFTQAWIERRRKALGMTE